MKEQAQGQQGKVVGSWNDLPFRIHPQQGYPTIRQDDPAGQQPALVRDAQVRVFDLSDTAQLQEYQETWDKIAKGQAIFSAEDRQFCEATQNWKVFIRWGNLAYEMPKGTTIHDGQSRILTG